MPGPSLDGKITLDGAQAEAVFRAIAQQAAAAGVKLDSAIGRATTSIENRFGHLGPIIAAKLEATTGGAIKNFERLAVMGAAAAAAAAAATGVVVARGTAQIFESGRALQMLHRQTGANVVGLAILQAKFKEAGLGADGVGRAISRLQKTIAGSEDYENTGGVKKLRDLVGGGSSLAGMDPVAQFNMVGAAIAKIQDPAERTAAAMKIFGKAGAEMGTLFNGGDFGVISPKLAMNAQILARNAALFEQVSIKLEKVGEITKTFYLGVADRVATTLGPILDRLEKINLVQIGQQFGDAIANGGKMLIGALQLPETALAVVQNGLEYAFSQSGNVLVAALKTGIDFFQDGMLASLQGIGSVVIATMMRSFAKPIAYLQAGIEYALQRLPQSMGGADYRDPDEYAQLRVKLGRLRHLQAGDVQPTFMERENDRSHFDGTYDQAIANTQSRLAQLDSLPVKQSFADIYKARQGEATRFGLVDGGQTADELEATGRAKSREGMAAAWAAASHFKVEDKFGAAAYGQAAAAAAAKLGQMGQGLLGPGTPSGTPTSGLSASQQAALIARAHMALVSSHAPAGADSTAYMFMPDGVVHDTAWGRTNATDAYTARVDAARRSGMFAAHTIGVGGALDFDPSTGAGWTGATNAYANGTSLSPFRNNTGLSTGGLGGGAYGASGNIWRQVSGYGPNSRHNSPEQKANEHLQHIGGKIDDLYNLTQQVWQGSTGGSKGGSRGGGAATEK